ncbi:hypothetical protein D6D23_03464 [Aureobasidium pullulans]|nr:hypothetical protein D6D23_03464 [Aureobasidium pullulans]
MVHPNHLPPVEIDLSTYISDSEDHAPADKQKLPDTHCLIFLTRVFNNNGSAMEFWGRRVRFTALCPGYSMYRGHPHTYPDFEQERRVWGHPCGKPFPSIGVFAIHVRAVIEEDLRRCRCWLCVAPDTESDPSYVKGPFDLAKMRREGISLEESGADVIGLMRVNEALQQMYLPSLIRKGFAVLSLDIHVEIKIILPFDRKSVRVWGV